MERDQVRRGYGWTRIPNPGLTLGWPHPSHPCPLNKVRRTSPECQSYPRVVLDTQVWLPARDGDKRSHLLLKALCLIPEENAEQRLWEGLGKMDRLRASNRLKLEGTIYFTSHTSWILHDWVWLQGIPDLGARFLYFNSLHKTFDLISNNEFGLFLNLNIK